ncbi:MAG: hypothetical protein HFI33_11515 [Lachnospiraceae bacterium]|nr:hypothetical protein [Lachnospiraceae bacterium]
MNTCQYIPIHEFTCQPCDHPSLRLKYFLTCRESEEPGGILYGICIRKYTAENQQPEEAATPPISYSESFVRQLLQHLIENAVTPMCLLEVLDELLSAA